MTDKPNRTAIAKAKLLDFDRFEENIRVSLWGRGKATLVHRSDCPEESPLDAKYRGDCDNCAYFMGVKFPTPMPASVTWGTIFGACCWKRMPARESQEANHDR